jgi:uncharacterized protein (UPF0264 family)
VAKLLVSVRSAIEAQAAVVGGAAIVDVKEPSHGPLGRASWSVWSAVRAVVPGSIPLSVALGELTEWLGGEPERIPRSAWSGIEFCKLGLAHVPPDWRDEWRDVRSRLSKVAGKSLAWIAVVYTDWQSACAPDPDDVVGEATQVDECRGVLFDTWNKFHRSCVDFTWTGRIARIRDSRRLVALAGGLDVEAMQRLAPLEFDIVAVRGAACAGRDRCAAVDPRLVSMLAQAAAAAGDQELSDGFDVGESSSTLSGDGKSTTQVVR